MAKSNVCRNGHKDSFTYHPGGQRTCRPCQRSRTGLYRVKTGVAVKSKYSDNYDQILDDKIKSLESLICETADKLAILRETKEERLQNG